MSADSGRFSSEPALIIPDKNVAAQDLVAGSYTLAGWLRKRGMLNTLPGARKVMSWSQRFVVLHQGCMYNFRSETAKMPSGAFSLYGYNTVYRAGEVLPSEAPWAFKICHTYPEYKTYYFSAASEQDMKEWMKQVRLEMLRANNKQKRTSADGREDDDDRSLSYEDLEKEIYDDASKLVMNPNAPRPLLQDEDDDQYHDSDDVCIDAPPPTTPRKPAVPPNKPTHGHHQQPMGGGGYPRREPPNLPPRKNVSRLQEELAAKMKLNEAPELPKQRTPKINRSSSSESKAVTPNGTTGEEGSRPDGDSLTKKHTEHRGRVLSPADIIPKSPTMPAGIAPSPPEAVVEKDYWSSIYFKETPQNTASELIRRLAEDGVFLVRDSSTDNSQVLVVFVSNMPKKYRIRNDIAEKKFYLVETEKFDSLEQLIYYYHDNKLPCNICLKMPYFQHPKYKE